MTSSNAPRFVSANRDGDVYLTEGLSGQDDYIDDLTTLYEHLQLSTVETAHPELDVVSFATTCFYFGIILFQPKSKDKGPTGYSRTSDTFARWESRVDTGCPLPDLTHDDLDELDEHQFDASRQTWFTTLDTGGPSDVRPLYIPRKSLYSQSSSPQPLPTERIGLVYLTATPINCTRDHVGELNIGIILNEAYRGKGYAHQVLEHVTKMAFDEIHCHRLQASILDSWNKDVAISLFTQLKFTHEGIRRLSHFNRLTGEWKNVTHYALLATEWLNRAYIKPAPKSLWDELFARHAREREDLLRWEDRRLKTQLKRTSSMETILPSTVDYTPSVSGDEGDGDYDHGGPSDCEGDSIGDSRRRSSSPSSMILDDVMDRDDGNPFDHPDELSANSLSPRPPSPATSIAKWDLLDHRSEPSTPHT
ncbi:hypothetical protein ONZ45_g18451 [Pleurotus djamor]|nr:hypothetical protein ONZ45_g18451 [Pleurotus djamor]